MFINQIKTFFLLAFMTSLLLALGYGLAGQSGLIFALALSLLGNLSTYWYADRVVLRLYGAKPMLEKEYAAIHETVQELCEVMKLPVPKLYLLNNKMPNAFATGRNPGHAAVALTTGIIELMEPHQLRAVLAHELAHVKNRDILVGTIAAVLATAVGYLADMIRWSLFWGSRGNKNEQRGSGVSMMVLALLTPLIALLIQLAISRTREYMADSCGARDCGDPLALAEALEKLMEADATQHEAPSTAHATAASLFLVYPFRTRGLFNLFSTHPSLADRIHRLRSLAEKV